MNSVNRVLMTDSYKFSHDKMLAPGVKAVSSYIEARRGGDYDEVVFFGLQGFIDEYFSSSIEQWEVDEARELVRAHMGIEINPEWDALVGKRIPLTIEALPEGTVAPAGVPLVQVMNNDGKNGWLTSYFETAILKAVWYPSTVATRSRSIKKTILKYLRETGCENPETEVLFKLHDFGYRGVSSEESAAIGGAAHLVNFRGTDTVAGLRYLRDHYGEDMAGFSIPAAEHSVICSWGEEHEANAYANILGQFKGMPMVAIVADTYNLHRAVRDIFGAQLHSKVTDFGGTVVIRPDSGDPKVILPVLLDTLADRFGFRQNQKAYKILPKFLRVIWGDGIDGYAVARILEVLRQRGWAAENVAFGMGGQLLQGLNRDTIRFAMKASAVWDGKGWTGISKRPETDLSKSSKAGLLGVRKDPGTGELTHFYTEREPGVKSLLEPVYFGHPAEDDAVRRQTLAEIRERASL